MYCVNPLHRDILRQRTDECKEVFDRYNLSASREDFELLVGRWTRLLLAIKAASPWTGGTPAQGGRLPVPKSPAAA